MSPEAKELVEHAIPAAAAILGALVGMAGTVIVTLINRHSEDRKHLRSLAFTAGTENFRGALDIARSNPGTTTLPPLEHFILNMKYLCDIIQDGDISSDQLKNAIEKKNRILKELGEMESIQPKTAIAKVEPSSGPY